MFKIFVALFGFIISSQCMAGFSVIKCSLEAGYEIYRGEGLVERGQGSLVAIPVSFSLFTNEEESAYKFVGGYSSLGVQAKASTDLATITLSGGMSAKFSFHPRNGLTQTLERGQLAGLNYTGTSGRISFTRAELRCLPAQVWDERPVIK